MDKKIECLLKDRHPLIWVCIILSAFTNIYSSEDIPDQMAKEVTSLSSLETFYFAHTLPYEKRYIFEYLPEYLSKFEVTIIPEWVINGLDSALDSKYTPLTIAATKCIGTLEIDTFFDRLTEEFVSAKNKKANLSLSFRVAVIEAMKSFKPAVVKNKLTYLLNSFSEENLLDPDFDKLMELTIRCGEKKTIKDIERFENKIKKLIGEDADKPEKNQNLLRVSDLIKKTRKILNTKEGNNE